MPSGALLFPQPGLQWGVMETQVLQQYDEWLAEHLDELLDRYPGRVVAIYQERVIAVGESEDEVYRDIRRQGLTPMPLVFRVPSEEDLQSILYL